MRPLSDRLLRGPPGTFYDHTPNTALKTAVKTAGRGPDSTAVIFLTAIQQILFYRIAHHSQSAFLSRLHTAPAHNFHARTNQPGTRRSARASSMSEHHDTPTQNSTV